MQKKLFSLALAALMLLICASCAAKNQQTSQTTTLPSAEDAVPEPPVSLEVSDEAALKTLLTGTWRYCAPGEWNTAVLTVKLAADGSFTAATETAEYLGTWTLSRFMEEETALPNRLTLALASAAPGQTPFGDFTVGLRTECGGEALMLWSALVTGTDMAEICRNASPVMRKVAVAVTGTGELRKSERFLAVCWKTDGNNTVLWLDDVEDLTGTPHGERSCAAYALRPDADLRCLPSLLAPGGFFVQAETDENGEIVLLNWVTSEEDLIQ